MRQSEICSKTNKTCLHQRIAGINHLTYMKPGIMWEQNNKQVNIRPSNVITICITHNNTVKDLDWTSVWTKVFRFSEGFSQRMIK